MGYHEEERDADHRVPAGDEHVRKAIEFEGTGRVPGRTGSQTHRQARSAPGVPPGQRRTMGAEREWRNWQTRQP
ncbi:MAG: hypothetical protein ACR2LG_02515 [Actinomycetota bacterium]